MYGKTLIDRALKEAGSEAALAREIGVSRQTVNKLAKGAMKISPETAALLAAVVHDDPHYAMEQVAIENAKPDLASRLTKVFHRAALVGVAAMSLISHSGDANAVFSRSHPLVDSLYIVAHLVARCLAETSRLFRGRSPFATGQEHASPRIHATRGRARARHGAREGLSIA